ncbi:MAG: hypothetical protein ACK4Z3_00405 [Rhizobium rosettiformans]
MPKIVKFDNYSEAPAADLNAVSTLMRGALDYIVKNLLFDESRYVGYNVSMVDAFNISVAVGGLISGGKVFDTTTVTSLSVTNLLPTSNFREVLVVVSGEEVETDTATRKFLTDVTTRTTQPRPTTTRIARQASVELVAGAAAASPSRPSVPAGSLVVASFRISSVGIVSGSIEMEAANSAYSLENTVASVAVLNANLKKTESMLNTLRSDIASLAKKQTEFAATTSVTALNNKVKSSDTHINALENKMLQVLETLSIADTSAYDGYDTFSTADESETTHPSYTAQLEAGRVRFGEVERSLKLTALLNPNDSKVDRTQSGLIMPKGADTLRIEVDDKDAEVAIASYAVTTTALKQKQLSRTYTWYASKTGRTGQESYFASNPNVRLYDPIAATWVVIDLRTVKWQLIGTGVRHTWKMKITSAYWEQGEVTKNFTGARLCQTFLCSQSGWHRRIDLGFTDFGSTGDVHIAICKLTDAGYPDEDEVMETCTVAAGALKKWPTWTAFNFDPIWLDKGERYGIIITTTGNHKLGMSQSNDLTNGTLMTWTSGSVWSLDLNEDVCFRLYGVRFDSTQVLVEIEDISMTGGMTEIQSVITGYEPSATALILQARIGGVWRNVDESDETLLVGKPSLVPLRFLFKGTKDVMPALNLTKSAIIASRPLSSSVHISTARTLPGGVTTTRVDVHEDAIGFDEVKHDWTVKLLTGAFYATEVDPTSVITRTLENGLIRRQFIFTGLPAISAYKIKTVMATTDVNTTFDVTTRRDYAAG